MTKLDEEMAEICTVLKRTNTKAVVKLSGAVVMKDAATLREIGWSEFLRRLKGVKKP